MPVETRPRSCATELADRASRAHQRNESLTFPLSPPILRDLGLTTAVEWLAEDIGKSYGLRVHVEHDGEPPLDEATRITVFRSVRELLINARSNQLGDREAGSRGESTRRRDRSPQNRLRP